MSIPEPDTVPPDVDHGEAFVRALLADLARQRYSLRAWGRFLSRSWDSSLAAARIDRARLRSAWVWSAAGAVAGTGMLALGITAAPGAQWSGSIVAWSAWYLSVVAFLLTHLGMLENDAGVHYRAMHLPNGLTFLRIALAPLIVPVVARVSQRSASSIALASLLVALPLFDLFDGWLARRWQVTSRLGRMLDPMADIALALSLAVGLWESGSLPTAVLALLVLRYPGLMLAATVAYFRHGPVPIRPTRIGRITAATTSIVLVSLAVARLAQWHVAPWIASVGVDGLAALVAVNIGSLVLRRREISRAN